MATTWFCLVAVMLAIYVLLDGFDFGAGAIQMLVARTPEERRQAIASIGPFPALHASGFSGGRIESVVSIDNRAGMSMSGPGGQGRKQ